MYMYMSMYMFVCMYMYMNMCVYVYVLFYIIKASKSTTWVYETPNIPSSFTRSSNDKHKLAHNLQRLINDINWHAMFQNECRKYTRHHILIYHIQWSARTSTSHTHKLQRPMNLTRHNTIHTMISFNRIPIYISIC